MSKLLKYIGIFLVILVGLFALFLAIAHFTQLKQEPKTELAVTGTATKSLKSGESITITSMNIGYCGLSADMDFVMDGGKTVRPPSAEIVRRNLSGVINKLKETGSDIYLLQEVDVCSARSYRTDQAAEIMEALGGLSSFAHNYKALYVPYPFPQMLGRVESGLLTLCDYPVTESFRTGLHVPFSWPVSLFQLKRCLMVTRLPIEGSDKELVIINLHLDAYDDGSGRTEQTKALANLMRQEYEAGNYVIAGGDFNQTFPLKNPERYALRYDEYFLPSALNCEFFPENFQFLFDEEVPSSRLDNAPYEGPDGALTQHYVIDGFIVSPNVIVHEVQTLDCGFEYSDHNPVQISISLAE